MSRRGKRTRIARGIYRDRSGIAAIVRVRDWRKEKRFPPDAPLPIIQQWQAKQRARFATLPAPAARGTFAHDVERYLELVRHLVGWISVRAMLRAWLAAFPSGSRYRITPEDIRQQRSRWLTAKVAPKTVNLRVDALRRVWRVLDGPDVDSPCDGIAPLPIHKTPPQVIPATVVQATYQGLLDMETRKVLRDANTRARFMVMASTGKRPSEIMRAERGDVDLERRVWIVRDGKGGYSPGVYLNDDMRAAWQVFIAAGAWGKFREGAFVRTLRSAGWPAGVRPYQLRHTVGMLMSDGGVDLADIQAHLGHTRIETTRKHYVPVIGTRLQRASELLGGRFGWADDGTAK